MSVQASFSPVDNKLCHRCRNVGGTNGPDSSNHLCALNSSLYVVRTPTVSELFDNYEIYVGGFTLPGNFVEPGFTSFPCPIEMIVTNNNGNYLKIGHGCSNSGPFYVYLKRDGTMSLAFFRVNGTRISSRSVGSTSSVAVHYNSPTAGLAAPPGSSFGGIISSSTLPNP